MKKFLKDYLPLNLKLFFKKIFFIIFHPKLLQTHKRYLYTNEHLKFVHILESINYQKVAGNNGKILPLTFFEFGIHSGRTFCAAINAVNYLKIKDYNFYAFDSFQGLPETNSKEDGIFKKGTFNTSTSQFNKIVKRNTGYRMPDSNIIKGFYKDSLDHKLQSRLPKAGIIHIDVDLYFSTVEVLKFLKPLLVPGSLLLFDDWYCFPPGSNMGEKRAFNEFLNYNPQIKIEDWKSYSTFGKSFFEKKYLKLKNFF